MSTVGNGPDSTGARSAGSAGSAGRSGSTGGLERARAKMSDAGIDPVAIETFAHYYRLLEHGETGLIPESSIEPLDSESLDDVDIDDETASPALRATAVIKLNGGLGTSMGMERAKSLLCVRKGMSFLDVIARQVLHLRREHDAPLPLLFMNSFRTSADTMDALARYADLPVEGLPLEFLQNREPKLLTSDLTPVSWPREPDLEWCPPGHGDLYTALRGTGLLQTLLDQGYERAFVSNSDNLGAVPDARVAGWFAESGAPFAIEAVRRTPSDRKGGHFARRKSDGRIVLRETAQTSKEDQAALADLDRHRFCSTNNLWFDLRAMAEALEARRGILGLPMIRNVKTVDPADPSSPEVVQIETAMGAAIEVFEGARTIEVGRDRFVPVKTTNDLLVLRSDVYDVGSDFVLDPKSAPPYVELDPDYYKLVPEFERRFPEGAPSLRQATSLRVRGDVTFGANVTVIGEVSLQTGAAERVETGSVLEHEHA
jgi:UTP--glucose-1-phosphate uridylyltransferase